MLSREEAHYLRSRGIGCVDLLGVKGNEASLGEAHVAALPVNGRRATSASTASHRSNVSLPPGTTGSCKAREIRPLEFHTRSQEHETAHG